MKPDRKKYKEDFVNTAEKYNLSLYEIEDSCYESYLADYFEEAIYSYIETESNGGSLNKSFTCCIFYTKERSFNAHTFKSESFEDVYYIALSRRFIKDLMKYVAKSCKKDDVDSLIDKYVNFDYNILKVDSKKYNRTRLFILYLILVFVIQHEVGHILCGHREKPQLPKGYKRQVKEVYADLFAFYASFNYFAVDYRLGYVLMYACITWWNYLGNGRPFSKHIGCLQTHPHALTRMAYTLAWLIEELKQNSVDDNDKDEILSKIFCFFRKAHDACVDANQPFLIYERDEIEEISKEYDWVHEYYRGCEFYNNNSTSCLRDLLEKKVDPALLQSYQP